MPCHGSEGLSDGLHRRLSTPLIGLPMLRHSVIGTAPQIEGFRLNRAGDGPAAAAHLLALQSRRPVSTSGLTAFADVLKGAEPSFGLAASQPRQQQSASGSGNRDVQSCPVGFRHELAFLYYLY